MFLLIEANYNRVLHPSHVRMLFPVAFYLQTHQRLCQDGALPLLVVGKVSREMR